MMKVMNTKKNFSYMGHDLLLRDVHDGQSDSYI